MFLALHSICDFWFYWLLVFSADNFMSSVMQFYIAGTDTTSSQLYWFYLFAGLYPEVQEKIYQEIKLTLGRYHWLYNDNGVCAGYRPMCCQVSDLNDGSKIGLVIQNATTFPRCNNIPTMQQHSHNATTFPQCNNTPTMQQHPHNASTFAQVNNIPTMQQHSHSADVFDQNSMEDSVKILYAICTIKSVCGEFPKNNT